MKKRYPVTGMTCAACAARVEKAARAVDGVADVSVNLLKNTMEVEASADIDERTLRSSLAGALEHAGYGLAGAERASSSGGSDVADDETLALKRRLIASVVFAVPLMYCSMAPMFALPLPSFFVGAENALVYALFLFLLVVPVLFINRAFFVRGGRALLHGSPTMDSLVALGSGAAVVYGVWALFQLAYSLGHGTMLVHGTHALDLYFDSAAMILTLITVGKYLEARAKGKTTDSLSQLMGLSAQTAIRLRDGIEEAIAAQDVRVGDVLVVKAGATVPVDGVVLEGAGSVDESLLTGEPLYVGKRPGDGVTGATINESGWFTMRAERVGADTVLAGIVRMVDDATASKAPIQKLADRISAIFVPVVMAVALATLVVWLVLGADVAKALSYAISVLVISCPCALGLATPTAIMVGMGRGATQGILIKSAEVLERAHDIKTVVLDKTGTITVGSPRVVAVRALAPSSEKEVLAIACALEGKSEHPLARAIIEEDRRRGGSGSALSVEGFSQVAGEGVAGDVGGRPCLVGNARLLADEGVVIDAALEESVREASATAVFVACEGRLIGCILVADEVKPTSAHAVGRLRARGYDVVMLTGDSRGAARRVAREVGIDDVVSDVLPSDKERVVREREEKGPVAMVGDGVNDAPALARADVGIAIGAGADIALSSADIVLTRSDLDDVASALDLSDATMRIIKQNLFWALCYNAVCIPVAAGALSVFGVSLNPMIAAGAMSLSSLCVVTNALRLRGWKPVRESGPAAEEGRSDPRDSREGEMNKKRGKEQVMEKTLLVEGMMCQKCVAHVKRALEALDGVEFAHVDLDTGTARVELTTDVSDEALVEAVVAEDYEARMA